MQMLVINLQVATDRLCYMRQQLAGEFVRIEAVRGSDLPDHLTPYFPTDGRLGDGEIGCYASHLLAAEQVLAHKLPYAVILEDDVEIDDDPQEVVARSVATLRHWDVISLSGAKQHPHIAISNVSRARSLVRYLHFPKTTAAYVLSHSGSRKLLRPRRRIRPIDVDMRYGWEMALDVYGVYPPPARQSGRFVSSIPKSGRRFYWRSDPLSYVLGRLSGMRRLGVFNAIRWLAMR
jgi:glycosyl transferase, family 25